MARTDSTDPVEIELKLAVEAADEAALRRRLARLGTARTREFVSDYYDTADFRLARQGAALRVRRAGTRWVQTLKTGDALAALASRGEWETPAPGGRLALERFADTPLATLLPDPDALAPRFRTRFERAEWQVRSNAAHIEVVLDRGEVEAGSGPSARRLPFVELELELKRGAALALFDLALRLQGGAGAHRDGLVLLPWGESKAARGVRLATGAEPAPVKAAAAGFAAQLAASIDCAQALRAVVAHGTDVLLANVHGALCGDDPEFVHQARVALRRVRSAVRLFCKHVDFPAPLLEEMRWIAGELGAARDWDVLVLETLPRLLEASTDADADELRAAAMKRQQAARSHARAALRSPRFATLALALLRWAADTVEPAGLSLADFAGQYVRRAARKFRRRSRSFASLSVERRHRVRILAKRLRYALDLLAAALPAKTTAAYVKRLARLQDELGRLNDLAVMRSRLPQVAATAARRQWLDDAERRAIRKAELRLDALARSNVPGA